jgi:hypothetical protein
MWIVLHNYNLNAKFLLYLIKQHAIKMYGEAEV